MKLRVRVYKQTCRVDLQGPEPTLTELEVQIREILLPAHGLSPDAEFTLSLNGTEPLSDAGQTLPACGVVSGDLICVIFPRSVTSSSSSFSSASPARQSPSRATGGDAPRTQQRSDSTRAPATPAAPSSSEPSGSSRVTAREAEPAPGAGPGAGLGEEQENPAPGPHPWEPMLCSEAEEGKVPLSLEVLYHGAQCSSTADALMVAVHLLMVETGFIPQGSDIRPGEMPGVWRAAGGVYRLQYTHPHCGNSLPMVVAVSMGPVLVVNATLKMNEVVETVRKLSLNLSTYVTDEWPREGAAVVFKDLRKLSRIFRDQLVFPLIATAREAMALPAVFGLCALPPELLLRVQRLLDVRSLVALSAVDTHLRAATAESTLWRHVYHRDFRDPDSNRSRDTDWKELYKRKYKWRPEYRHAMPSTSLPHPLPPIYPIPPDPFNPPSRLLGFPGIIGGEYDQRPGAPYGLLPRPRYDPIGPLPGHDPLGGGGGGGGVGFMGRRGQRPTGGRPADNWRGFI